MNLKNSLLALALGSSLLGCAAPNKVLVAQTFIGEDRSIKLLMTVPAESQGKPVVDQYIRICTLKDGAEVDCKDTLVLENVKPGSIY